MFKSSRSSLQRVLSIRHLVTKESAPNPIKLDEKKIITDKFSTLRERYEAPKYPIVLCHGFSGFDQIHFIPHHERVETLIKNGGLLKMDYWYGIKEALEKIGSKVLIAKVPAFGTISERATHLNDFINVQCEQLRKFESKDSIYVKRNQSSQEKKNDSKTFEEKGKKIKINLIAHSMGGLDSRYLISKLEHPSYQIVSLTTVSTPHHGSECADFLMDIVKGMKPVQRIYPASVSELTTTALKEFNKSVPDDKNVAYFSYGARFKPHWFNIFKITWEIIKGRVSKKANQAEAKKSKPGHRVVSVDNDGVVSVESSKWGEYLGTLDEVDHLDLINWTNRARAAIDKAMWRKEPKFNAIALYLDIADNLRKRGF